MAGIEVHVCAFLNSVLDGDQCLHALAALHRGKVSRGPLDGKPGGLQGRSEGNEEKSFRSAKKRSRFPGRTARRLVTIGY
jgi:hypothetical protein